MARKTTKPLTPSSLGFIQALGVTLYCSFVGVIFWKGNETFGKMDRDIGPVAFLLLFIASAMICALMVFYRPYLLFFDGRKREAIEVVVNTATWLFIFFTVFFIGMAIR